MNLKYDEPLSNFAFDFNLRPYIKRKDSNLVGWSVEELAPGFTKKQRSSKKPPRPGSIMKPSETEQQKSGDGDAAAAGGSGAGAGGSGAVGGKAKTGDAAAGAPAGRD